jgi:hypothetical protein
MRKNTKLGFLSDLLAANNELGIASAAAPKPIVLTKSRRFKNLSATIVPFPTFACNVVFEAICRFYYNAKSGFWQHFFGSDPPHARQGTSASLSCCNTKAQFFVLLEMAVQRIPWA